MTNQFENHRFYLITFEQEKIFPSATICFIILSKASACPVRLVDLLGFISPEGRLFFICSFWILGHFHLHQSPLSARPVASQVPSARIKWTSMEGTWKFPMPLPNLAVPRVLNIGLAGLEGKVSVEASAVETF